MKARIIITQVMTQTQSVFECNLKIILSESNFDSLGFVQLKFTGETYFFTKRDLSEIHNELKQFKLDQLLLDIKEFIKVKWQLCQVGKFKFTDNFEFLIKDI